jgi:hypothetical protein
MNTIVLLANTAVQEHMMSAQAINATRIKSSRPSASKSATQDLTLCVPEQLRIALAIETRTVGT